MLCRFTGFRCILTRYLKRKAVPDMNGRRQVVITKISGKRILLYMENEKIYDVLVESVNHDPAVGNIYVGKVQNIVKNISAAFVEVQKGVLCY